MHDAQRAVAMLDGIDNDAHGKQVINLIDLGAPVLHLVPRAVQMLGAAEYLGWDRIGVELTPQLEDNPPDVLLAFLPPLLDCRGDRRIRLWLQVLEGQVFEL